MSSFPLRPSQQNEPRSFDRDEPAPGEGDSFGQGYVRGASGQRRTWRECIHLALEIYIERCSRVWLCNVICVAVGMCVVLIWSQIMYDRHKADSCDQPLAVMLRVLYVIIPLHAFKREIIRYLLCYEMARDGPVEPCRVLCFQWALLLMTLLWPLISGGMLARTHSCSTQLVWIVEVVTVYYAVSVSVVFFFPAIGYLVVLVLVRCGVIRGARGGSAAPEGFVDRLPRVPYDPDVFNDDGGCDAFSTQCSVCLEDFDASREIVRTNCQPSNHVFHKQCLAGWLENQRTCPLCRSDLTLQETAPEVGMELV